jgi:hypothetical protein
MSLISGFIFYIVISGFIARWLYWKLAFLLQSAILLPFILPFLGKLEKTGQELTVKQQKKLFIVGAFFTFVFCVEWTLIVGYLVLIATIKTSSFDWHKWIFIIGGFFLAMYLPSDGHGKSEPQDIVAYPTVLIFYILQALFILFVELPKFVH